MGFPGNVFHAISHAATSVEHGVEHVAGEAYRGAKVAAHDVGYVAGQGAHYIREGAGEAVHYTKVGVMGIVHEAERLSKDVLCSRALSQAVGTGVAELEGAPPQEGASAGGKASQVFSSLGGCPKPRLPLTFLQQLIDGVEKFFHLKPSY